jgi:CheY-like chemotaxis protein
MGYTSLLQLRDSDKDHFPEEKINDYLAQISTGGQRAKQLVEQLLLFSRGDDSTDSEEIRIINVLPVVKEVVNLLHSTIPKTISINYKAANESIKAGIHAIHLHQILLNLAINARDAIEGYGEINIYVGKKSAKGKCAACFKNFQGGFVEISVHDNGSGIPEEIIYDLFNPFFSTKDIGKGTGMGLSVIHGVVHNAGGHITVSTTPGAGTAFSILLPLPDCEQTDREDNFEDNTLRAKAVLSNLRIAVIDDEQEVATTLLEQLSFYGANVAIYLDPKKALLNITNSPDSVDLIITNEIMPNLSGLDFSKRVLEQKPNAKIFLCTGYSAHVDEEIALNNGIAAFLSKPIDFNLLVKQIKNHTDRPKA